MKAIHDFLETVASLYNSVSTNVTINNFKHNNSMNDMFPPIPTMDLIFNRRYLDHYRVDLSFILSHFLRFINSWILRIRTFCGLPIAPLDHKPKQLLQHNYNNTPNLYTRKYNMISWISDILFKLKNYISHDSIMSHYTYVSRLPIAQHLLADFHYPYNITLPSGCLFDLGKQENLVKAKDRCKAEGVTLHGAMYFNNYLIN